MLTSREVFFDIARRFARLPQSDALLAACDATGNISLRGLQGSSLAFLLAGLRERRGFVNVVLAENAETASYLFSDLSNVLPPESLLYFPSSYTGSFTASARQMEGVIQRMELIERQRDLEVGAVPGCLILTYLEAVAERFVSSAVFSTNAIELRVGEQHEMSKLLARIEELGFERTEFVYEPGKFALRGSILDIFSLSDTAPYRVDFLGDEIDSIRLFDVETQLSVEKVDVLMVVPEMPEGNFEAFLSLFDILPPSATLWSYDLLADLQRYAALRESADENLLPQLTDEATLRNDLQRFTLIEQGVQTLGVEPLSIAYRTTPQPTFRKNFSLLSEAIAEESAAGRHTLIFAEQQSQIERMEAVFDDLHLPRAAYRMVHLPLHAGFKDADLGLCIYTDHQIFDRYHRSTLRKRRLPRRDALRAVDLQSLEIGDYVVHVDHGVGYFEGLIRMEENGVMREFVRVTYRDKDTLFVSIHNLHRLSKYRGKDGVAPTVHKLGSGVWSRAKQRVKGQVKDIARDLIKLYAQRREQKGFAFSPDSYLQEELESSFIYQDTPDQLKATEDVKRDMESAVPMDRLVCGDVGFGKTEVAVRAAFKAVADSKQVAMLVPTTILALQHYKTFSSRLRDFPCRVEYISRLKTRKQQDEILLELASGKVDMIIGTHALLRDSVRFKDLGLLIVDEEQKFGVAAKERLKRLRLNVDTLTLSATPIPRTLQFSLMGARDLSIISTPPPNRYPIHTEVCTFDEDKIREAIQQEISRGGQVFFVHNRVHNLPQIHQIIVSLLPEVRCIMAHGQMKPSEIEGAMLDFIAGDYDVLLCTSIIESGLDIPNANTIIINNGHMFGLSDLHQLRGRVGRTNRKAYCYILTPITEILTDEARRRLRAIEDFSDLGSGLNIAMQDLDIRGAGNLLGAEQSGFIVDLGYETYLRILDEAMYELKMGEFSDLFQEEALAQWHLRSNDCQVETDLDISLPEEFVQNPTERIRLYREIDQIRDAEQLSHYVAALRDRFGELPAQAAALVEIPPLKWLAAEIGVEKLTLKRRKLRLQFLTPIDSPFYASELFGVIVRNVQRGGSRFMMRQSEHSLRLEVHDVSGVQEALRVMKELKRSSEDSDSKVSHGVSAGH